MVWAGHPTHHPPGRAGGKTVLGELGDVAEIPKLTAMSSTLQNWSGSVQFKPNEIAFPTSEEEVSTLVRRAATTGQKVRVVGAAHSFTPLAATTDIMVSLDKMQGLIHAAPHTLRVTVWAGTRLKAFGELLHSQGLAMENLGDIDVQSIAGALSTGTHGTGIDFGTLATQLRGITFVDGSGEIRHITMEADPDIFPALLLIFIAS